MQAVGWAEDQGRRPEMEDGFVFVDQAGNGPGVTNMGPTTRLGLMFDTGQTLGGDLIHQRPSPGSLVAASAVPSSRSMMGMVGGQWSSPEGRCGMVGIS